jgi:hypothetical protein
MIDDQGQPGIDQAGHQSHTLAFSATVPESFRVPFQILLVILLPGRYIYLLISKEAIHPSKGLKS